jgi:uncharacterized protein (TIGR04222 family)
MRRSRVNAKFGLPGAEHTELRDPYEIAFLAGGVPRCTQVALVNLMISGTVTARRTRIFRNTRLVAVQGLNSDANHTERTLYQAILGYREKGMPLDDLCRLAAPTLSSVESRLAKLGLRPTASETAGRGFVIVLPMVALMAIGIVKVIVSLSRDKPVMFLILFLCLTVAASAIVASTRKKLTPQGERLLLGMRAAGRGSAGDATESTLRAVALGGIAAAAGDPLLAGIDHSIRNEISKIGHPANNGGDGSGCGTTGCGSSGCGSSGCGGGCGGCGGGD